MKYLLLHHMLGPFFVQTFELLVDMTLGWCFVVGMHLFRLALLIFIFIVFHQINLDSELSYDWSCV